jgi:hypothetical protein
MRLFLYIVLYEVYGRSPFMLLRSLLVTGLWLVSTPVIAY